MTDEINIEKLDPSIFEKEEMPYMLLPTKVIQQLTNHFAGFIWVYLQSLPPTWEPNKFHLMSHFKIGERTYQKHMAYLADVGLISYSRNRNSNGTLGPVRLIVHNGSNFKPGFDSNHTAKICVVDFNSIEKQPHRKNLRSGSTTPQKNHTVVECGHIKYIDINKINNIPPISPKGDSKGSSFSLSQMLEDNPFNIPADVLADWIEVRKGKRAKLTNTAWSQANNNLRKLKEAGLDPKECFLKAVASGWSGIEFRYFKQDIEALAPSKPRYPTPDERAANEQKIREREYQAQKAKEAEIETSRGGMSKLKQHINLADNMRRQEEHRKELGLSVTEYHEQIILGKNKGAVQKDPV